MRITNYIDKDGVRTSGQLTAKVPVSESAINNIILTSKSNSWANTGSQW